MKDQSRKIYSKIKINHSVTNAEHLDCPLIKKYCYPLECNAVRSGRLVPTYWRHLLPLSDIKINAACASGTLVGVHMCKCTWRHNILAKSPLEKPQMSENALQIFNSPSHRKIYASQVLSNGGADIRL
jgi:hypothetical protein